MEAPATVPAAPVGRLQRFGTTIFAEMTALAERTGAVNLGQGFPDTDGPPEVLEAAVAAIRSGANQYPPGPGVAALREAVARHQRRFWGMDVDPDTGVVITTGATEAIAAAVLALCEPGDEVVTLEPWYDSYAAVVELAGARLRTVTLRPPEFRLDPDALAAVCGPRTRLILLNTPHNPTGRVLDDEELAGVASVVDRHGLVVVTDEVYEHIVFSGRHRPFATLEGMADRTLTVSSAGKTFSVTGWKVGWACGPAPLVAAVRRVKQFLTYVSGGPFQHAVAVGLDLPDGFFAGVAASLAARSRLLVDGLREAGFAVHPPQGTYFVLADARPLGFDDAVELCRRLPGLAGVVAVPAPVFYTDPAEGRSLVRFACCKQPEILARAVDGLRRLADRRDRPAPTTGGSG